MEKFIYSKKNGGKYAFYVSDKMHLIKLSENNIGEILAQGCTKEFYVFKGNEYIGIIYQSVSGELILLKIQATDIKKELILKCKREVQPFSKITSICLDNTLHIFYILTMNRKNMLIHHILADDIQKTPTVISEISSYAYSVAKSKKSDTIYICYIDRFNQLSLKEYDTEFGVYSEKLIYTEDSPIDVSICTDSNDHLHIFSANKRNSYYTINYLNYHTQTRKPVGFGTENYKSLICYSDKKGIYAIWEDSLSKYEIQSKKNTPELFSGAKAINKSTAYNLCIREDDSSFYYLL